MVQVRRNDYTREKVPIILYMKKLILAAVALSLAATTFAQKGVEDNSTYGHGEDSIRCIQNVVLYSDAVKLKNFQDAYTPWRIVFDECPLAKKTTLYTDGVKIVKDLYQKADASQKEEYYDLLIKVYDQRIKYYGKNAKYPASYLQGMKALDILAYKQNNNEATKQAVELFEIALSGEPATIQPAFTSSYMFATATLFKEGVIDAETVVNNYLNAASVITKLEGIATEKNAQTIADAKVQVEQVFAQSGAADCETIAKIFGPQLSDNKDNVAWLTRVNKLLANGDCTDDELFYSTSEYLHKIEPAASSARGLARMYMKQNDAEKAVSYYNEAIGLETEDAQKAKYYYELSMVYLSLNNYAQAKSAAQSAAKFREGWGDPYLLLGKIYAAGARNIGDKDYEKRAGYWAAVDKFQKAMSVDSSDKVKSEATELIRQYSQHFPSKEDLFFEGLQTGTSYTVGGFINETTKVRPK